MHKCFSRLIFSRTPMSKKMLGTPSVLGVAGVQVGTPSLLGVACVIKIAASCSWCSRESECNAEHARRSNPGVPITAFQSGRSNHGGPMKAV